MKKEGTPAWLRWAREIQQLCQTGLAFSENDYDTPRYKRLTEISAEIIAEQSNLNLDSLTDAFLAHPGYATPKVDIRSAIIDDNKILLVQEVADKRWSMPGGWADVGESPKDAVIRETKEECGLSDLNLEGKLGKTYHVYEENGAQILKKTTWFKMTSNEEGPFQGDSKEGISEVKWMNASEWEASKEKSYPSIIDLLSSVF